MIKLFVEKIGLTVLKLVLKRFKSCGHIKTLVKKKMIFGTKAEVKRQVLAEVATRMDKF